MIYTCYDMVGDCRADRAEGWSYFVSQYVPAVRKLVVHYFPTRAGDDALVARVLAGLRQPQSNLFASLEPSPERWFVAELRQRVLGAVESLEAGADPDIEIGLETLAAALAPFTVVEKQAIWLESMRYAPADAGVLLRMEPRTVEKIRDKAAERIRQNVEAWRRTILADNGAPLGRAAAAAVTPECLPAKAFLDVLDGRTSWSGRENLERHVTGCWHCIDHFCRLAEVIELLRGLAPLADAEARPFREALGIVLPAKRAWKRWFA